MNLGERLRELRKKNNLSQDALAKRLSISRQAVSRWENNLSTPDLQTLINICKLYGISLDAFVDDIKFNNIRKKPTKDQLLKAYTPYLIVLIVIMTMIAFLPGQVKIPFLFFGSLALIFLIAALLIYYIIKNYLSK